MANIGQFSVGTTWTKLEDITSTTITAGNSYTIQNKKFATLLVCESATQPTDTNELGFAALTNEKMLYTAKSGVYLWLRAYNNTASFNIAEE